MTAERFIPNPFALGNESSQTNLQLGITSVGTRLYRTGDLARYRLDGSIDFLGRIDHQVKIRGFRIELGEIEAKLQQHPGVIETVVLAREDLPNKARLIAYFTADIERILMYAKTINKSVTGNSSVDQLEQLFSQQYFQEFVKESLPDYMAPSCFIYMKSLPCLPNGKVDRNALPLPEEKVVVKERTWIEPSNVVEKTLISIWQEVLNIDTPLSVNANFFNLGGHSLLAIQVISRIQDEFNIELSVASIFETPTLDQLASQIIQQQMGGHDQVILESLLDEIEQLSEETGVTDDREIASARWFND